MLTFVEKSDDWHSTCKCEGAVSLGKKRWGKRFSVLFLPGLRNQGLEGPPHRVPDFCLPNLQAGVGNTGRTYKGEPTSLDKNSTHEKTKWMGYLRAGSQMVRTRE